MTFEGRGESVKTSEALRATKACLWDGVSIRRSQSLFICVAATFADVAECVHPIIHGGLGYSSTLSEWIREQYGVELGSKPRQLCRHAWLDKLILEYEAAGD